LSFAEERIEPLAAIVTTVFYLLALYLLVLPNTPENMFASIYSDSLIKTAHQHLLFLVGFDTLIYRKYYDTPPILVGHHRARVPDILKLRGEAQEHKAMSEQEEFVPVSTHRNQSIHIKRKKRQKKLECVSDKPRGENASAGLLPPSQL
jgi:hypothetical protein